MKATVELVQTVVVDADDAVIERLMSPEWQADFYTFHNREEAVVWLADVLYRFDSTEHVDGLVGIGRAIVLRERGGSSGEVIEISP